MHEYKLLIGLGCVLIFGGIALWCRWMDRNINSHPAIQGRRKRSDGE